HRDEIGNQKREVGEDVAVEILYAVEQSQLLGLQIRLVLATHGLGEVGGFGRVVNADPEPVPPTRVDVIAVAPEVDAFDQVEPGQKRVRGGRVVGVGAEILRGQLPARRQDPFLRHADDFHLGPAENDVEVPADVAEEVTERDAIRAPG